MSKKDKSRIEEPLEAETVDETAESMVEETLPEEELEAVGEQLETQDLEELHKLLEEKDVESAKNLEGWQRSQAEFINYRKRMEREQSRMYEDAAARIIKRFLPLLDDLHRALQNKPENGDAAEWAAGIELVYRKMLTILEGEGVTVMDL
ncbi:MAG: nucleotide exchange factor GrpE, partial [Anaerolineales bacterium]